jgi:peptidyl-prolyl cis-trans isomerase A (cyclophilin A)
MITRTGMEKLLGSHFELWSKNFLLILLISLACCKAKYTNPHIEIQTRVGEIEVELYPDKAPKTVAAFLANVEAGVYKNCTFYRVLSRDNQSSDAFKTELIQGGIWNSKTGKSIQRPFIPHETTQQTGILHKDGIISLARLEPGTATTEFFICIGDQAGLDYGGDNNPDNQGYAAFGKVVKGMEVVNKIYNRPEQDQHFDPPIDIYNIIRL